MLKKLLKHEWKAAWKIPTILIVILEILSIFAGFTFSAPIWDSEASGLELLLVLVWMLYYFAIIGVSIGVMIYMAVRFYKNMYTDEGYLTHTLPVTSHQLLLSKVLPIAAWIALSMAGIFISICIFGSMAIIFLQPDGMGLWETIVYVAEVTLTELGVQNVAAFLSSILLMLVVSVFSGTMMIIGSITIGQLVGKHKILGSIGAYFGINTIVQILSIICMIPVMMNEVLTSSDNVFAVLTPICLSVSILSVVIAVALYFISEFIIRKKLNLD